MYLIIQTRKKLSEMHSNVVVNCFDNVGKYYHDLEEAKEAKEGFENLYATGNEFVIIQVLDDNKVNT